MEKENNEICWYVSLYSNGLNRTYSFKSEKVRDLVYESIIDISLRNCSFEINDCKFNEKVLFKHNVVISKGKQDIVEINDFDFETEFYEYSDKNKELIISAMGLRI